MGPLQYWQRRQNPKGCTFHLASIGVCHRDIHGRRQSCWVGCETINPMGPNSSLIAVMQGEWCWTIQCCSQVKKRAMVDQPEAHLLADGYDAYVVVEVHHPGIVREVESFDWEAQNFE